MLLLSMLNRFGGEEPNEYEQEQEQEMKVPLRMRHYIQHTASRLFKYSCLVSDADMPSAGAGTERARSNNKTAPNEFGRMWVRTTFVETEFVLPHIQRRNQVRRLFTLHVHKLM